MLFGVWDALYLCKRILSSSYGNAGSVARVRCLRQTAKASTYRNRRVGADASMLGLGCCKEARP